MLNKTHKEMNDFTLDIKTIKSHEILLSYIKSNLFSTIKLLISVSHTFSIYWKVVLPFIVSLSGLLVFLNIKPFGEQLQGIFNINYIFGILLSLVLCTLAYILHCKKYFILCIENSKIFMEKDTQSGM